MRPLIERISTKYLETQVALHAMPEGYGGKGKRWAETVIALIRHFDAWSVLDYGCGRGTLAERLKLAGLPAIRIAEYDPAVRGKDKPPMFADLVTSTDVLEHIEPDRLDAVLEHLHMLTRKAALFVVHTGPANKLLGDGRNAHLIQEDADWWRARVTAAGFTVQPWQATWPVPLKVGGIEENKKHWIAVVTP